MPSREQKSQPYTSFRVSEHRNLSPIDPDAVRSSYRLHKARRKARQEHRRRSRRAGVRFWLTFLFLLVGVLVLVVTLYREIQDLFGI